MFDDDVCVTDSDICVLYTIYIFTNKRDYIYIHILDLYNLYMCMCI
jgi:hypothetical protein